MSIRLLWIRRKLSKTDFGSPFWIKKCWFPSFKCIPRDPRTSLWPRAFLWKHLIKKASFSMPNGDGEITMCVNLRGDELKSSEIVWHRPVSSGYYPSNWQDNARRMAFECDALGSSWGKICLERFAYRALTKRDSLVVEHPSRTAQSWNSPTVLQPNRRTS